MLFGTCIYLLRNINLFCQIYWYTLENIIVICTTLVYYDLAEGLRPIKYLNVNYLHGKDNPFWRIFFPYILKVIAAYIFYISYVTHCQVSAAKYLTDSTDLNM